MKLNPGAEFMQNALFRHCKLNQINSLFVRK